MLGIITTILYVLFAIDAILLIGIVLLQEGKGGGLGAAFGGAGGEIFGHGVGGINKATGVLAAVLFLIAIGIALIEKS
jgi:preprotein translocase subunit SecG